MFSFTSRNSASFLPARSSQAVTPASLAGDPRDDGRPAPDEATAAISRQRPAPPAHRLANAASASCDSTKVRNVASVTRRAWQNTAAVAAVLPRAPARPGWRADVPRARSRNGSGEGGGLEPATTGTTSRLGTRPGKSGGSFRLGSGLRTSGDSGGESPADRRVLPRRCHASSLQCLSHSLEASAAVAAEVSASRGRIAASQ
jgi:hypothetical protein